MLFPSIFSLLALAALGQAAPAPAELEPRAAKYHCVTKYAGKLSGEHNGATFSWTKSGNLVTYSGDHPTKNILNVEFQACSGSNGKITREGNDYIGRLRIKKTNSCIDLSTKTPAEVWLPKIVPCSKGKLTAAQTWRYDYIQFGLFWGGFYNFDDSLPNPDGEVCRGGYETLEGGVPAVTARKQMKVACGADDDAVKFFKLQ